MLKKRPALLAKALTAFLLLSTLTVAADAATSFTASWTAPTMTISLTDCNVKDRDLVASDFTRIVYIVSYREVGATTWLSIETPNITQVIPNLKFATNYEFRVGAKWSDGSAQCFTDVVIAKTKDEPNPGKCSTLTVR